MTRTKIKEDPPPMSKWLMHHGILGQKWGKRNGPPYPLDAEDHSASEKKAGWRKSIDVRTKQDKKDDKNIAKATKIADKINKKGENGSVYVGQQILAKYLEEHGADSIVKYAKSDQYKEDVKKAIEAENIKIAELQEFENILIKDSYSQLKDTETKLKDLIKEKHMGEDDSTVVSWFAPNTEEQALKYYSSDELHNFNIMADEVYSQMKKWVDMSDQMSIDKRQQSTNKIEFYDMFKKSKEYDREYGERENFILNSEAMKKFFKDPVVKDVLTMRNRMLDAEGDDMVVYGVPTETNRMLRYRANALFGGSEDAVSKIMEMLDTSNDYNESLNPYYNDRAWLYWH